MKISASCRVIRDAAGDGAWNMAVDEALLEAAAATQTWALRFYGWSQATLSLGYFQRATDRDAHRASRDCQLVRRPSGGGAIVHDVELTYCAVVPASDPRARHSELLYEIFHNALAGALPSGGVSGAGLAGTDIAKPAGEPFLCFQRRMPMDVVLHGIKIAGSAQRRRFGAVLQHGSVLLGRSAAAPELPGIAEVVGRPIAAESLVAAWLERLGPALSLTFEPGELTETERGQAERLRASKYAADWWNLRR
jgi:lipoate-protein ligase A